METKLFLSIAVLSATRMSYLPIVKEAVNIMRTVILKELLILFLVLQRCGSKNVIFTARRIPISQLHLLLKKKNLAMFLIGAGWRVIHHLTMFHWAGPGDLMPL